jgi:hypothetical protein
LSALVFDITVGVVAAFGSSLTIQRLRPKITLKSVLAAVACVCCVAAWEADKWNLIWLFVACLFVSYTALGVAWFAALGLAGAVWKKFADGQ